MRGLVGYDQPDDADGPPDKPPDRPARRVQPETRNLEEYYADLRTAVAIQERNEPATRSEPCARSKPDEQSGNDQQAQPVTGWEENAELSRWMWSEYQRRWPSEERPPVDRSADPPGSWRGDSNRFLDRDVNERIEAECDRIAEREEGRISPALRAVASQDPNRHLIGVENCRKGADRIKEKVYAMIKELRFSPEEAVSHVPDAIRYTFQYDEAGYTGGVRADIARLQDQGFKLDRLKNSWSSDQYKGINSQWTDFDTGQRFEVQFHTRISFEAKQITHTAYERLRSKQADAFEELVLEAFQNKVAAAVPTPPGATDIPDYPKRGSDGR
jgi:hypothetical protein